MDIFYGTREYGRRATAAAMRCAERAARKRAISLRRGYRASCKNRLEPCYNWISAKGTPWNDWPAQRDSNPDRRLRRPMLYPAELWAENGTRRIVVMYAGVINAKQAGASSSHQIDPEKRPFRQNQAAV